ncbi:glycosyltransferase family 4 protein [Cronobacter dublinensis]|uniref:glycosyltransferase family 4 protein n=1 Tax=Cronobacter dublinensis TaxID=413497 RepID=UPI00131A0A8E|nr:glycosyltransferase family 4 protein [Cronobacter dublinensis]EKK4083222.1 glycosyltransferase family 4 protein [Cronobacter dublinensis]
MTIGLYCNWKIKIAKDGVYINKVHAKYLNAFMNQYGSVYLLSNVCDGEISSEYIKLQDDRLSVLPLPYFRNYIGAIKYFTDIFISLKKLARLSSRVYVRTPEPFSWLLIFFSKDKAVNYHFTSNPLQVIKNNANGSLLKKLIRYCIFYPEFILTCIAAFAKQCSCNGPSVLKNVPFFIKKKLKVLIETTVTSEELALTPYRRKELSSEIKFICVTRLQNSKGVHELIHAVHTYRLKKPMNHLHLSIVGDGPLKESLLNYINQVGCQKHVTMCGPIENGAPLNNFYREHDVLINASSSETGPRVILEAMSESLLCISTDVGYVKHIFEGKPELLRFLINNDFENELHEKFDRLFTNRVEYPYLTKIGYDISKKYTLNDFVRSLFM